jgi:hypothetical protein
MRRRGCHALCCRFGLGAGGSRSCSLCGRYLPRSGPSAAPVCGPLCPPRLRSFQGGLRWPPLHFLAAARDRWFRAKALPPPALGGLPRRPATSARPAPRRLRQAGGQAGLRCCRQNVTARLTADVVPDGCATRRYAAGA